MFSSEETRKLRELGLTTLPEVVREAVQRIRNGEPLYRLHTGDIHLVAKGTATKIKDLANKGQLNFLFEVQPELEAAKSAMEAVDNDSPGMISQSREAFNNTVRRHVSDLPNLDWDIEYLESTGIPLKEALALLVEWDDLDQRMGEWKSSDLERYLEIYRIVYLCHQHKSKQHKAIYEVIKLAAKAWAKGEIDENSFLQATSRHMLRYQIWRGKEFIEAFKLAQVATTRAERQYKVQYEEFIAMIDQDADYLANPC